MKCMLFLEINKKGMNALKRIEKLNLLSFHPNSLIDIVPSSLFQLPSKLITTFSRYLLIWSLINAVE